ncbi:MAG: PAS domain-containing protein [Saprospiraceae bacterium]
MHSFLSPALQKEVKAAFDRISDLPFPVHASDAEGNFLFANDKARKFFKIEEGENLDTYNVGDYYDDLRERIPIVQKLRKAAHGKWVEDLTTRLGSKAAHQWVRFSGMPFFDGEQSLVAVLKIADPMGNMERFQDFEKKMPVGFFELNQHMVITSCNQKFAEILNYETERDLVGKTMNQLMWEPDQAAPHFEELKGGLLCEERQFKMRRKDGAMAFVRMNCLGIPGLDGDDGFRAKGTAQDVTFEVIHNDLPVGLFLINSTHEGEDIISQANLMFAKIHGYQSVTEVIGKPASTFQPDPDTRAKYRAALEEATNKNEPLLDHYMEVRDKDGNELNVVVNVYSPPTENKQARVGTVYNLTNHVGKYKRELEANFSGILHTYISTVVGLRKTLLSLVEAYSRNIFRQSDKQLDRHLAALEMAKHTKQFEGLAKRLYTIAKERGMPNTVVDGLNATFKKLTDGPPPEEGRATDDKDIAIWGRDNLVDLRKELEALRQYSLPKELTRDMRLEVENMMRISSMVTLSIAITELNARIYDFKYLQKFLLRGDTEQNEFKPQNILPILAEAVRYLEEFATERKVTFYRKYNPKEEAIALCHSNSLNRAFYNLLHNAIKYSWGKSEQRPFVEITVEKTQDSVVISMQNWGVPIRDEEIKSGFIYQFARRGRESDDRDRAGTGIGLYDTNEIVKKHKGTLVLTSEPTLGNLAKDYRHPFITTAIITLPLYNEK